MRVPFTELAAFGVFAVFLPPPAGGQGYDFSGTYHTTTPLDDELTLTLTQDLRGTVRGTLAGQGGTFSLEGNVTTVGISGSLFLDRQPVYFEAFLDGARLILQLSGDASGRGSYLDAGELVFLRALARPRDLGTDPRLSEDPPQAGDPLGLGNPLAPAFPYGSGNYGGTYTDGFVTLELRGGASRYSGYLTIAGRSHPVTAALVEGVLEGSFANGLQEFPFRAYREGLALILESEGQTYFLQYAERFGPNQPGYGSGPGRGPLPGRGGLPLFDGAARGLGWTGWTETLRGRRLTTYPRGRTGQYGMDLALCGNGEFLSGYGSRSGGRGYGVADGYWRVSDTGQRPFLELTYANGRVDRYSLSYQGNITYLDGQPVSLEWSQGCR